MTSEHLATLLVALGGTGGLILGLYVAAAGLVFGSVVQQAGDLKRSALSIAELTQTALRSVPRPAFDLLFSAATGYSWDDFAGEFGTTLVKSKFHPREFDITWPDRCFVAVQRLVDRFETTEKALVAAGDMKSAAAFHEATGPLLTAYATFSTSLDLYVDVYKQWHYFKTDLRFAGWPVGLIGASLLVSGAAYTGQPSIGQHEALNLVTGGVFVGLTAVALGWLGHRLRQFASAF